MKKFLAFILCACFSAGIFAFASCTVQRQNSGKSGDVVLTVESAVFTVKDGIIPLNDTTSLKDYMDALKANGELEFEGENGDYGFFIKSVYGRKAEDTAFWAVYTDLKTLEGDDAVYSSTEWGSFTYGNKILGSAGYGVSYLPCISGYTYALVYSTY